MALTEKQKLFVKEYLSNGKNVTQAALAAGYSKNGRPATAAAIGHETLKNPSVRGMIQMALAEAEADLDRKAMLLGITKAKLLAELKAHIAMKPSDIFAVLPEEGEEGEAGYKPQRLSLKPTVEWSNVTKRAIKKIKIDKHGGIEIELHSKDKAIDQICKMMGWTKEQFEISGHLDQATTVNINLPDNGRSVQKPKEPSDQEPSQDGNDINEGIK